MERPISKETINKEGTFDIHSYSDNINNQKEYIQNKISSCEMKLKGLQTKENIISNMITRQSLSLEKHVEKNNYKLISVSQQQILHFFETLALAQEMLIKYEDMIQKYLKMIVDIENHKINAYVKIKTADKSNKSLEGDNDQLLDYMQKMMLQSETSEANTGMTEHIKHELKLEGY